MVRHFAAASRCFKVPVKREIELALQTLKINWHWRKAKDKLNAEVQKRKRLARNVSMTVKNDSKQ